MTLDKFRTRLLASTFICTAIAAPAFAQSAAPAPAAEPADSQLIVVTGSLIKNPNLVAATPVTVVGEDELKLRQTNLAEEVLRELPGVVPSIGSAVNNGNGGASFVDLRGLGSNRNIVLLDGNRLVPSGLVGRVDLNNIPVALVQRVDVLTGGASTTYGADAVSGVVNFVTKQDFSGVEINAQEGITEKGDGNRVRFDLTLGANTDDGKGNVTLSIGYQQNDPVYQGARDVSLFQYDSFTGGLGGSGTTVPSRFSNVNTLGQNQITTGCGGTTGITCVTTAQGTRVTVPGGFATTSAFTAFNFNPYNIFQTPFERYNIFSTGRYEVADNIEVYARGLYSKNTVQTIIAPSGAFGISTTVNLNNPFLSAAQRNAFCQFDTDSGPGYTPRFDPTTCANAALATGPSDPRYRTVTTTLFRRATEVGPRISTFTTQIFDYRMGVRGKVTDKIDFDFSGSYGESENTQVQSGYLLNSRTRQSLLVDGTAANPVCTNTANGCTPVNWFGPEGSITPANTAFLTGTSNITTKVKLGQIRGTFTGELPVTSPFASDAISFAVGAEYRDYTATISSDSLSKSGDLGGAGGAQPDVAGGYEVYEGVAELVAPLVSDRPFFKSLELRGGARYSSYSVRAPGSPGYTTWTWNGGGSWEPVEGVRFRGNVARAVRAPNISELFSPLNTGLTNLADDPCASLDNNGRPIAGRAIPTGTLRDVCIAQGASPSTIGTISVPIAGQANSTGGGNLALKPETSTSFTIGAVIAPKQVRGLSVTVDYFNIEVTGAVSTPTPQDAIDACFKGTNLSVNNPACVGPTGIGRNSDTGNLNGDPLTTRGIFQGLSNLGYIKTSGIDLTINYQHTFGPVKWASSFVGTWTKENIFQATPTGARRDCVGYYSVNCSSIQPKYQWTLRNTFSWMDVDLSLLWRHLDGVKQEPADVVSSGAAFSGTLSGGPFAGQQYNFGKISSYDYFDLSARFNITENTSLTLLVSNLTDEKPPLVGNTIGSTAYNSGNTYPSTYDALGRRYSVNARIRF